MSNWSIYTCCICGKVAHGYKMPRGWIHVPGIGVANRYFCKGCKPVPASTGGHGNG